MIHCRHKIENKQIFFLPTVGYIDESGFYGYKVFAVAFAWLNLRFKVEFGIKKYNMGGENNSKF